MTGEEYFNLKRSSNVTVETPFRYFKKEQVLKVEYIDSLHQQVFLRDTTKELGDQYEGQYSFLATLKDIYHDDNGNEKYMRYKVLLWANNLTSATHNARELQRQGYDMQIEGLKEVDYTYI